MYFLLLIVVFASTGKPLEHPASTSRHVSKLKDIDKQEAVNVPSTPTSFSQPDKSVQQVQEPTKSKTDALREAFSPQSWSQWALFVVGIGGIWVGLHTLKLLVIQTEASVKSAEAAKQSAEVAELALKISQRAEVLLDAAQFLHGEVLSGKHAQVQVQFKNFGPTSAKNAKLSLRIPLPGTSSGEPLICPPITIGPGDSQKLTTERFVDFMTEETAKQVFSGQIPLRFQAEASYDDVFHASHKVRFKGTFDWKANTFRIDEQNTD